MMTETPTHAATDGDALEPVALCRLEQALDHAFADPDLPRRALTHSSWTNERGRSDDYERLEFLGDAVLGLLTGEWLFRRHPDEPEGRLAKHKSYLVSAPALADFARSLDLGAVLRLGVGEERSGGRDKASILADVVEALFGALYLDGGLEAARGPVERFLEAAEARRSARALDAKTRLQELTQSQGRGLPSYVLVTAEGPDHAKTFTVECRLDDRVIGLATGRSKKDAEKSAAAAALENPALGTSPR
ncbi:MAG: ribonuclease III [Acidobacteriota bacterium]